MLKSTRFHEDSSGGSLLDFEDIPEGRLRMASDYTSLEMVWNGRLGKLAMIMHSKRSNLMSPLKASKTRPAVSLLTHRV